MTLLPTSYLAPIIQYAIYARHDVAEIEAMEHFAKQSYRNRCYIYGANGNLMLSIPLDKRKNHAYTKDIRISYTDPWQELHWRSFEAAYRTSPFFEYYEEYFRPFYEKKIADYLMDWNEELESVILKLLKLEVESRRTSKYIKLDAANDYRTLIHPKRKELVDKATFPSYAQVFEEKFGFLPNLSIIDLLCNEGPASADYLKSVSISE